eukprot:CAMPEP_0203950902 /NCGR_PEP_ID=MMETSP0359-20131031/84912_1 /ASSEMBLY_ACC=CAM_ASM_000338 /TAXON_ID=268821 /ORGANISM="Scrippsiella Hangoei, Strain SHTV-5" /LENGTH=240 /DNA_ID=CAMNT_0050883287 /DNA_START=59 /DNA_END=781 /DNA_ORIENTATION=+
MGNSLVSVSPASVSESDSTADFGMSHARGSGARKCRWVSLAPGVPLPRGLTIGDVIRSAEAPVFLNVYELGRAPLVQRLNMLTKSALNVGGLFHAGIEVRGKEWSFGSATPTRSGIFCCRPCSCSSHTYRESIFLGDCGKRGTDVREIVQELRLIWTESNYDRLHKNCCHFSVALAGQLGVTSPPAWVHHFADAGANLDLNVKAALQAMHSVEEFFVGRSDSLLDSSLDCSSETQAVSRM